MRESRENRRSVSRQHRGQHLYCPNDLDSTCTVPTIKSQYIIWNANAQGTLTVYDISGREVIKEESKATGEHKTDIKQLKSGIYFIKLKDKDKAITEKYCKIE